MCAHVQGLELKDKLAKKAKEFMAKAKEKASKLMAQAKTKMKIMQLKSAKARKKKGKIKYVVLHSLSIVCVCWYLGSPCDVVFGCIHETLWL